MSKNKPINSSIQKVSKNKFQLIEEKFRKESKDLNYEEALGNLESILNHLQDDSIPLDELQNIHLKGKIYLEHCLKLLENTEQEMIEFEKIKNNIS
tara:strand:+ start:770 stop:1057 length:288 start_codon:yes stop_codon:yes gene_type:complete